MRIFLAALVLACIQIVPASAQTIIGTASVIDGDTIEIHDQRIRLHGIDSPEGGQPCTLNGKLWRCGPAAALALADRIERRTLICHQRDVYGYERVVAMCEEGGEDIGRWMVAEGWAMAYRQYSTAYVRAEEQARAARRGLWASEFEPPWEWRRSGGRN